MLEAVGSAGAGHGKRPEPDGPDLLEGSAAAAQRTGGWPGGPVSRPGGTDRLVIDSSVNQSGRLIGYFINYSDD